MLKINKDNAQSIYNLLSQVVLNGSNFVLIIGFTHFLSTADYGVVSLFISYSLFLSIIIGLSTHGSIGTAFSHLEKTKHADYLASILLVSCVSFATFSSLTFVFYKEVYALTNFGFSVLVLLLFYSFSLSCYNLETLKNIFNRDAKSNLMISVCIVSCMLALSFLGIKYESHFSSKVIIRVLSFAIPYMVCAVFIICKTFYNGNPAANLNIYLKFCLPICIPLIFHGLSHIVLSQTDRVMLQKILCDNSAVGIYSFIVTFSHVLNTLSIALNNTWVPIFYECLGTGSYASIGKKANNYAYVFSLLTVGFLLVVPEFVYLLAKEDYWLGLHIMPIISLAIFINFLYFFPVNFELYNKESRIVACGTIGAACLNIVLNYLLIPEYGMYGASLATLTAYAFLLIFHNCFANHLGRGTYQFNSFFFVKYIAIVVLACLIYYLFFEQWIVRWIMAVFVGVLFIRQLYINKGIF